MYFLLILQVDEKPGAKKPSWSVLQDNFMMGATMKDWDKRSDSGSDVPSDDGSDNSFSDWSTNLMKWGVTIHKFSCTTPVLRQNPTQDFLIGIEKPMLPNKLSVPVGVEGGCRVSNSAERFSV